MSLAVPFSPSLTSMGSGIDPILGRTQTWKLSQEKFIKSDENVRKDISYLYKHIIPYR
jgi:hypothetical protein